MHHEVSIVHGEAIKHGYHGTAWTDDAKAGTLMQFIGLKDKTDKELYSGDIVSASIYADEEPQILEVIFRDSSFLIDYEDSESDCVPVALFVGTLEIIGNIHENPELIAEVK